MFAVVSLSVNHCRTAQPPLTGPPLSRRPPSPPLSRRRGVYSLSRFVREFRPSVPSALKMRGRRGRVMRSTKEAQRNLRRRAGSHDRAGRRHLSATRGFAGGGGSDTVIAKTNPPFVPNHWLRPVWLSLKTAKFA